MAITRVVPALIQVANNVTSTTIGNTTSIPSLTFDASGVIIAASNTTVTVSNTNITGTITNSQLGTGAVSNTKIASGAVEQYFADTGYQVQFRNRIINGDMRIAQRGTSAVTGSGNFPVDRFRIFNTTDGAFSAIQDSSAPAGFIKSAKVTTTTLDSSLTTTQNINFYQPIEGTNVSDLGWGTANAKTVTLSFWVRSSLTGTFGGALQNSASNRSYPFTYTISAADTWEYKTITIDGDTSGTWLTDTDIGIRVFFGLGAGPDRSGTAGAWNSNNNISATGATSVIGTLNATWYITGVQLEVGSVATPFERRPFGTELALCQRYFYRLGTGSDQPISTGYNRATTRTDTFAFFPVTMRAAPTGTVASGSNYYYVDYSSSSTFMTNFTVDLAHTQGARLINTSLSGLTNASGCVLYTGNASANVGFSAEL